MAIARKVEQIIDVELSSQEKGFNGLLKTVCNPQILYQTWFLTRMKFPSGLRAQREQRRFKSKERDSSVVDQGEQANCLGIGEFNYDTGTNRCNTFSWLHSSAALIRLYSAQAAGRARNHTGAIFEYSLWDERWSENKIYQFVGGNFGTGEFLGNHWAPE